MAEKYDGEKLDWSLVPPEPLEAMIRVLMFGKHKYGVDNWRTGPNYLTRAQIVNAIKRHQAEIDKGNFMDQETGELHAAHLFTEAMFQLYYDLHGLFMQPTPKNKVLWWD